MIKIWEPLEPLTVNAAVIHFTFLDSCTKEIPLLLKGEVPSNPDGQLGSGNWSVFPKAILFGGGYTDNDIAAVRKAVAEVDGARKIPWLRVDVTKPAPPVGPGYGAAVVARAKEELKRLEAEGVFDSNDDSIRLF